MGNLEHIGKVIPRVMRKFKLTPDKVQEPKEWQSQRILFDYAKTHEAEDPRWQLLSASMNGLRSTPAAIVMAKMCGLRPGYLDTFLPVPQWGKYDRLIAHGMFVELKRKHKGYISWSWDCCATEEQRWWRDHLREQHYRVELAHGADEAIALYESYLGDTR